MTSDTGQRAVLDASALVSLFVPEEGSGAIRQLFQSISDGLAIRLHAPRLIQIEVAHAISKCVRRGLLTEQDARDAFADLLDLPLVLHDLHQLSESDFAWSLARVVSAYDAAYVSLAMRLNFPLITQDQRLAEKVGDLVRCVALDDLPTLLRAGRLQ